MNTTTVPEDEPMPSFPDLSDGNITLRLWTQNDVSTLVQAMSDPDIPRWLPLIPQPYGSKEASEFITWSHEQWARQRGIHAAVVETAGVVVGSVGMDFDPDDQSGSLGYWVTRVARGRGVATRATGLLAGWGIEALGLQRIELLAEVDNYASQRVAEKAGFRQEALLRSKIRQRMGRKDAYLYSLLSVDLLEARIAAVKDALDQLQVADDTAPSVWQLALDTRYALRQAESAVNDTDISQAKRLLRKAEDAAARLKTTVQ